MPMRNSIRVRWVGRVALMREMRNAYKILVGKQMRENDAGSR
jgi:hypothetical protein